MRARTNFLRNAHQQFATSRPVIILVNLLWGLDGDCDRNIAPSPHAYLFHFYLVLCPVLFTPLSSWFFNAQYTCRLYKLLYLLARLPCRSFVVFLAICLCEGTRSFLCNNYVTPGITAAVLILAGCAHLSALCDRLTRLATNLKDTITQAPVIYSLFVLASDNGLRRGKVNGEKEDGWCI